MQSSKLASEINSKRSSGLVHVLLVDRVAHIPGLELAFENASFIVKDVDFKEFESHLIQVQDKETAHFILKTILSKDLAYGAPTMIEQNAQDFAKEFFSLFGQNVQCYSNSTWIREANKQELKLSSWNPFTKATFDCGILIIGETNVGAIWVEDED